MLDVARPLAAFPARRFPLPQHPDLEQVFTEYVDPIYRFLYRRVGNTQDAEDLTSEVFFKAAGQLDHTRSQATIARWLFTVARSVLADHWRRYYHSGASLPLDESRLAALSDARDSHAGNEGDADLVSSLLAALPERYRQVLELRFLQGYSIKETAHELAITPENVKVIQHRALAKAVQLADGRA